MSRACLIWSTAHNAWFRPHAAGYTSDVSQAGVFNEDYPVDPKRERIMYFAEAAPMILSAIEESQIQATGLTTLIRQFIGRC